MRGETKHIRFDWAAKTMLREKKNFDILEGFLSELLKEDIKIVGLLESESNQDEENEKFNRVDLYAEDSKGEHIIIEVQNTREYDYLMRMLFLTSKALTEYLKVGNKYAAVKKIIAISIVYFELGKGDDYIYVGQTKFTGLHNHTELLLTAAQKKLLGKPTVQQAFPEYYLIRTTKFKDVINNSLDEWIYFFKNSEVLDGFKARSMEQVRQKLAVMNMNEAERRRYKGFLMSLSDEASYAETINYDIEEAKEAVRQEYEEKLRVAVEENKLLLEKAVEENRHSVFKKGIELGLTDEQILRISGSTKEELNKFRQSL